MGKDYDKKDLREIDYKKGKEKFKLGILSRGKHKGTVVEEKDARLLIHRPAKRILDSKGTWREVEFDYWKREVINNPLGPTAQRAKKAKDPDLDNIKIDVIAIRHDKPSGTGLPRPRRQLVRGKRTTDLSGMAKELQQRPGFRSAEAGKPSKQKKVKKDGKGTKK